MLAQASTLPADHPSKFPRPAKAEEHGVFFDLDPDDLPVALQHGLPPAMQTSMVTTFWGMMAAQVATTSSTAKELLGIRGRSARQQEERQKLDEQSQTSLQEHGLQGAICTTGLCTPPRPTLTPSTGSPPPTMPPSTTPYTQTSTLMEASPIQLSQF